MIIKSNRVASAGSLRRLVDHLLHGDENDTVEILRGSERDIADAWRDAQAHGAAKALRVWTINPDKPITLEQLFESVASIGEEFGFDPARATIVQHGKDRATPNAFDRHWHVAVGEVDPVSGKVMSTGFDFARHEYLARTFESRFGHEHVVGRHTKAVLSRMRREGHLDRADALSRSQPPDPENQLPRQAFTTAQHQAAKRRGVDLPALRAAVVSAWEMGASLTSLRATAAAFGLELSPGDVAGEWLIRRDGVMISSLRRLVDVRKAAFAKSMEDRIDGKSTSAIARADSPFGDSPGAGGSRDPSRLRGSSRKARRERGELPGGSGTPPLPPGRRDRRDTSPAGVAALDPNGAGDHQGPSLGDPGGLTIELAAFTAAVGDLVPRAAAAATPVDVTVDAALAEQESLARIALARRAQPPGADVDSAKEAVGAEREKLAALNGRIAVLNDEIGSAHLEQRRRERSLLRRFFPDRTADARLADLRAQRDRLMDERRVATRPLLRALGAEERAERAFEEARARATAEQAKAARSARSRLTAIARARALLRAWPSLAYVGARTLLARGVRIEASRRRGVDPGFDHKPSTP